MRSYDICAMFSDTGGKCHAFELQTRIPASVTFTFGAVGAPSVLIYPLHFPSTKHFYGTNKENK